MAAQTVTATLSVTCHYTFIPEPLFAAGSGLSLPAIVQGYAAGTPSAPATLSLTLDDSVKWDVNLRFQGAPPIVWDSLDVTGGGDLVTLLQASGWTQDVAGP